MRVAVLYDIHSNLPALEAVLTDVQRAQVDCVVIGGDVFPGPFPRETISRLLSLDVPVQFIKGNGDREVFERMMGRDTDTVPERFREPLRWVANQLHPEYDELIESWPKTLQVTISG